MDSAKVISIIIFVTALSGCDDDDCEKDVSGCPTDNFYSCPAADFCYTTHSACSASGECD